MVRQLIRNYLVVTALLWQVSHNELIGEESGRSSSIVDASRYQSIQEAIDALPDTGGVVKIPPGHYQITEPLRVKTGDTRIEGSAAASHIENVNQEGQPALVIANPKYAGKSTPNADRLWRVSVTDLRITGNDLSGSGIEAHYVEEIVIEQVTSSHHGGNGVWLNHCYEDPRVVNNLLTYNQKSGLHLDGCHDIIVAANQFEENQDGLKCLDAFNLTMSGNNLDDHLGHGVVIENTYGSVIASNMIEECQGWAIVLDRDCYGITLSSNVIAHEFSGGIDLRDAHGCTISANTFPIVKGSAIAVRPASASITISGNNFCDTWIGNDSDGNLLQKRAEVPTKLEQNPNEAAGILLQGCRWIVINGNNFSRLSTEAIKRTGDCVNVLEQANLIVPRE